MKYLQILAHNDLKFNLPLFLMLHNPQLGFNSSQFTFVTPHEEVYRALSEKYDNIYFIQKDIIRYINQHGNEYDYIFIHALDVSVIDLIKLKNKYAKKIIWRFWGHDIHKLSFKKGRHGCAGQILKYMLDPLYKRKVRKFYGIGVAFKYDRILLEKRFNTHRLNTFCLGYSYVQGKANVFVESYRKDMNTQQPIRVIIGHSAFPGLNHLKILESLIKFKNENIKIILILSYGLPEYCSRVKEYARSNFNEDKLEIIEEMMPYETYMRFLSNIDLAIFDFNGSAALGNITSLLYFGAKFYVKRNSFLDTVFSSENFDYRYVDEISALSFEEFAAPVQDREQQRQAFAYLKEDNFYAVKTWHSILNKLENKASN